MSARTRQRRHRTSGHLAWVQIHLKTAHHSWWTNAEPEASPEEVAADLRALLKAMREKHA